MVLVVVEYDEDGVSDECLEAMTLARSVAAEEDEALSAVVMGESGTAVADSLGEYGAENVYVIVADELSPYAPEAWAAAVIELLEAVEPSAVIGAGIERTQEVLARVGARRDQPMAANCNAVTVGEPYEVIRQRWGGSLIEEATLDGAPKLLTVTPHETGATPVQSPVSPDIEEVTPDLSDEEFAVRIERFEEADIEGVPLGEARVVIGGGRGVGSAEDFAQLEELAGLLGGTVGSSRAAVNDGWRPHDDQIGLTGASISPDLYIPCGISGAVQHWVGCKGADHILAINTDEEAAIIQKSDWAVTGDLHEVVPAIVEELRARGYD